MSQYLLPEELNTVSRGDITGMITNWDDEIINSIVSESMELMKSYLLNHYDMDAEFAKTGETRNKVVLKYLKDIVIYEIYHRHTTEINEVAQVRYDQAMHQLKEIAKGNMVLDLKLIHGEDEDEDGNPDGDFFLSSGKKNYQNEF